MTSFPGRNSRKYGNRTQDALLGQEFFWEDISVTAINATSEDNQLTEIDVHICIYLYIHLCILLGLFVHNLVYLLIHSLVANSCQILETPWTVACQGHMSMGFSRQEYCSGLAFLSSGNPPSPEIKPTVRSLALQADFLWLSHQGSHQFIYNIKFLFWDLYVLYPVRYNSN